MHAFHEFCVAVNDLIVRHNLDVFGAFKPSWKCPLSPSTPPNISCDITYIGDVSIETEDIQVAQL